MEQETPRAYSELLKDLKTPLKPAFVPADTLMPAMLQRFGLDKSSVQRQSR